MDEQHLLIQHLKSEPETIDDHVVFSGFTAALRDARKATGRNLITGEIESDDLTCSWLGAVGYLILLDQIGTCFKPDGKSDVEGNTINRALSYFTELQIDDRNALYALRCAFAHDYSLVNENPRTKVRTHHFMVLSDPHFPVVKHPAQAWNGDYSIRTKSNATIVNVRELGEIVERIYRKLIDLAKSGSLQVVLPGGLTELISRYRTKFLNKNQPGQHVI
jgi:hypothetical protein